ncbi:histidine kinase dimerization/phosphoacceptor domain-containing protein [Kitasatospora brasiliensis]|uniref:histidine kinase dimerization/phosphoacceptor domain-containing protein n=1 Tax=Kitasatospora brasiliensis TaxID=3058040 RepID=UPI003D77D79C
MIAVQAAGAPYRITEVPAEAAEEFTAIAGTARESLAEMRRLLGVLRGEEAAGERAPQPGAGQLAQLVETVGRAGVPAEPTAEPGVRTRVPPTIDGRSPARRRARHERGAGRSVRAPDTLRPW